MVKPLAPGDNPPARTVIQAYFLTITNLNPDSDIDLDVDFISVTPGIDPLDGNVITFFDFLDANSPAALSNTADPIRKRRTINIPARDTGLFLLQPNVFDPEVLADANLEIRGHVEISVNNFSPLNATQELLVTPEHRGTFIPANFNMPMVPIRDLDFDQLAYALPVVGGSALVEVNKA
ncbi:hypothetical protein [Acaryochloris sp. IP29b_bin.137]|uniref:hypothetical protein n=1 Tax=Acaryochloris sp. IP29b_bin.137 TaxID=2969217 RepID=UPI0026180873|nr:hypothetical protein [Acaryochloris sp. IP29b_bin.137]